MSNVRIYAVCLASYNHLEDHGAWIDCVGKSANELQTEVSAMLLTSPYPSVTVTCPGCSGKKHVSLHRHPRRSITCPQCRGAGTVSSAAEFEIHDHEGLEYLITECSSLDDIAKITAVLADDPNGNIRRELVRLIDDGGCSLAYAINQCGDECVRELCAA
jgi:antirestriction protein